MIDSLVAMRPRIEAAQAPEAHGLERGGYVVVTLHRHWLVDGPLLGEAMTRLAECSRGAARWSSRCIRERGHAMEAMGIEAGL